MKTAGEQAPAVLAYVCICYYAYSTALALRAASVSWTAEIKNHNGVQHGVKSVTLDGMGVEGNMIMPDLLYSQKNKSDHFGSFKMKY